MKDNGDYALRQAERAAKRGDLAAAERWTKVAAQTAKQFRELQEMPPPPALDEDHDALREELCRRLGLFAASTRDIEAWNEEHAAYLEAMKLAVQTGAPPPAPLRPHPAGSPEGEAEHYRKILQDPEP